jgi:hypothetical protein
MELNVFYLNLLMVIKGGHHMNYILSFLNNYTVLALWFTLVFFSLSVVLAHIRQDNANIPLSAKAMWLILAVFTGPIALALYWAKGRQVQVYRNGSILLQRWYMYVGCGLGLIVGSFALVAIMTYTSFLENANLIVTSAIVLFSITVVSGAIGVYIFYRERGISFRHNMHEIFALRNIVLLGVVSFFLIETEMVFIQSSHIESPLFWMGVSSSLLAGLLFTYIVTEVQAFITNKKGANIFLFAP